MRLTPTELPEVLLVEPDVFGDARGWFSETWSLERYREAGITLPFVQDNLSRSSRGTLRGLHLQSPHEQGKLVYVPDGSVFDVVVDVRAGSPTFGRWVGVELSSENHRQVWIPPGFAHGFLVTSDRCLFAYKCTDLYAREHELGVAWDDPEIGIAWPIDAPLLSPKDASHPNLASIAPERLPSYAALIERGLAR